MDVQIKTNQRPLNVDSKNSTNLVNTLISIFDQNNVKDILTINASYEGNSFNIIVEKTEENTDSFNRISELEREVDVLKKELEEERMSSKTQSTFLAIEQIENEELRRKLNIFEGMMSEVEKSINETNKKIIIE